MLSLSVLQAHYQLADFRPYFVFLEKCKSTQKDYSHRHHICPRKQFPEYAACNWNLITLSPEEHAVAHKILEQCAPELKSPPTLWIESQTSEVQAKAGRANSVENKSKAGKISGHKHFERKTGIFSPNFDKKLPGRIGGRIAQTSLKKNSKGLYSQEVRAKGRLAAVAAHKSRGTGVYSKEMQVKGALHSHHIRWHVKRGLVSGACSLCKVTA